LSAGLPTGVDAAIERWDVAQATLSFLNSPPQESRASNAAAPNGAEA